MPTAVATTRRLNRKPHATNVAPSGTRLDERAMLVSLSIGFWDGRKKDSTKTAEVTKDEKADRDAGAWWTKVVPPARIKHVLTARNTAREAHLRYTLPWQDNGVRVLPATMFMKYTEEMRKAESLYRAAVQKFLEEYPEIVANAEQRLGGLFKADMFPSAARLADKYPWRISFAPLPVAGDFRVDLGADRTDEVRKQIQLQADSAMAEAMGDLWTRLHDGVSKMVERLGDVDGIFRDTLISNVAELCELLPALNVTGDEELERARQEVVAKLTTKEPEVLRRNLSVRADTTKAAAEILKKMEAFRPKAK